MGNQRQDFLRSLDEILELDSGTLTGAEQLSQLENWDSLALISFMAFANEKYGVILSPKNIGECSTVEDLMKISTPS